jgi:hypothetical protein
MLELINEFSKVAGYKNNVRNQRHFYRLTMNYLKRKLRKQYLARKITMYLGI